MKIIRSKSLFFIIFSSLSLIIHANEIFSYAIQDPWNFLDVDSQNSKLNVDVDELKRLLINAPKVYERRSSSAYMEMPSMNGEKSTFSFFETDILPQSLKNRYPMIKSYMGVGLDNPSQRASVVTNNNTLYGMIINEQGVSHIRMDQYGEVAMYVNSQNHVYDDECSIAQNEMLIRDINDDVFWNCVGNENPCYEVGATLTTYRFAGILSERANNEQADGTVYGGLTWMVSMVNQINLLWVRELGFQLQMVDESDQLIFTNDNPAPEQFQQDPSCHSSGDPKYCELEYVKPYLETIIGPGGDDTPQSQRTWEYGAHFDTRYNGGVAYAPGSTSTNNPNYEVFNHEIGHNLGSSHNISIENGWRCSIGGTIMGSRVRTLNGYSGDQYSTHTIELAMNYKNNQTIYQDLGIIAGNYVTGYISEETGNVIPEVMVPENGIIIPKDTPFILEGTSEPIHSDYTYSWEQNDASDESFSMNPLDENLPFFLPNKGPLFSTIDPTSTGYRRILPDMSSLLNNNYSTEVNDYGTLLTVERLPFSSREINMRLIVRTNDPYAGSVNHKNMQLLVAGSAGPFRVTSQSDSIIWEVGSEQTVTWDVANTNDPDSVNCQYMDIVLSLNGGETFDLLLAEGIVNNGSYSFTVPEIAPSSSARLMMRAVGNIFFDINNGNISIINNYIPSISLSQNVFEITMGQDTIETFILDITNDGEEGSVLNYNTYQGMDLIISEEFEQGQLPIDWEDTTNADCDNPGWFITEDASSSYFTIPSGNGYYIATNDDDCNSDGSNDIFYTETIEILNGTNVLSFDRFFTAGFGQTLDVLISTDGWLTSEELFSFGYLDGDENWIRESVNLNEYIGEFISLGFHSNDNGQWASGAAIDNIRLGNIPFWISSEGSTEYLGYMESSTIEFTINTNELEFGLYETTLEVQNIQNGEIEIVDIQLDVEENTVEIDEDNFPLKFSLFQNYPNPFNPNTSIRFSIPKKDDITLTIYDILGNKVKEVQYRGMDGGEYQFQWSGKNQNGLSVSAGMYFYVLNGSSFNKTRKMILLK